jgi:putative SOS response-associated peptidase YedK
MPVIIEPADYGKWLDAAKSADGCLLRPYPADEMTTVEVDPWVNDARHKGPGCIEPIAND